MPLRLSWNRYFSIQLIDLIAKIAVLQMWSALYLVWHPDLVLYKTVPLAVFHSYSGQRNFFTLLYYNVIAYWPFLGNIFGKQSSVHFKRFKRGYETWKQYPGITKKCTCKDGICKKILVVWRSNFIALRIFIDLETSRSCQMMIILVLFKLKKESNCRLF